MMPHVFTESMSFIRLDKVAEFIGSSSLLISFSNPFQTSLSRFDGASFILFAKVQMKGSWSYKCGNFRCVSIICLSRNEVWETMQQVFLLNCFVGWQTGVTNGTFQPGFERAHQPGMSRSHRVSVATQLI